MTSGIAVIAALIAIVVLASGQATDAGAGNVAKPGTSYPAALVDRETLGRADAPVTLEIWSDFQCPFCGQLARTYLPRLVPDFVVPGKLRIVTHDVGFVGRGDPDESVDAAVAAACAADQGAYWAYHDLLFWNQDGENLGAFAPPRLGAMADELGLDRGAWDACRRDPARERAVAATTSQAVASGIDGTPTLVVNGTRLAGLPRTYADLAGVIVAALPSPGAASPSAP